MSNAELYRRMHDVEETCDKHLQSLCDIEYEQKLMRKAINELGRETGVLPFEPSHEDKWAKALHDAGLAGESEKGPLELLGDAIAEGKSKSLQDYARETGTPIIPADRPMTLRDLEPDASFVEQVEIYRSSIDETVRVRLRFDDDETEEMGVFATHSSACAYAAEQARRYKIAVFDSSYEEAVD